MNEQKNERMNGGMDDWTEEWTPNGCRIIEWTNTRRRLSPERRGDPSTWENAKTDERNALLDAFLAKVSVEVRYAFHGERVSDAKATSPGHCLVEALNKPVIIR
jgi:hypothetical protein